MATAKQDAVSSARSSGLVASISIPTCFAETTRPLRERSRATAAAARLNLGYDEQTRLAGLPLCAVAVAKPRGSVRDGRDDGGMTQRFVSCDREQVLLMPVSLRDWLPESHLAWFVLAAVEELDLSAFYAAYRQDANGRPAHDPAMMVALLLYAYARGQRSSRVIERGCVEDVAFRVIAANRRPDHCRVSSRFVGEAGGVSPGLIAA